jgi:DNA-binding XRE family transcriptional regulator
MMSEKVREVRARLHLTQAQLAEQLDLSSQTVYYWESGKRQPSRQELDAC